MNFDAYPGIHQHEIAHHVLPHTPWKIDMEPTNHPFRKEHDLPNLHG